MNGKKDSVVRRIHAHEMILADPSEALILDDAPEPEGWDHDAEWPGYYQAKGANGMIVCVAPGSGTDEELGAEEESELDPYFYDGYLVPGLPCMNVHETEHSPSVETLDGALRWGRSPFEADAIESIYGE